MITNCMINTRDLYIQWSNFERSVAKEQLASVPVQQ